MKITDAANGREIQIGPPDWAAEPLRLIEEVGGKLLLPAVLTRLTRREGRTNDPLELSEPVSVLIRLDGYALLDMADRATRNRSLKRKLGPVVVHVSLPKYRKVQP